MTNTYRITPITRAQREALFKVFQRDFPSWVSPGKFKNPTDGKPPIEISTMAWRAFRKRACLAFGDCVMIDWRGMTLGIERDGYTHS